MIKLAILCTAVILTSVSCSQGEAAQEADEQTGQRRTTITRLKPVDKSEPVDAEDRKSEKPKKEILQASIETTKPLDPNQKIAKVVAEPRGNSSKTPTRKKSEKKGALSSRDETKKANTFYVIGRSMTVDMESKEQFQKALNALWSGLLANDFSDKLPGEIVDEAKVFTVLSDYGIPEGKVTITLGYQVKSLAKIPAGFNGKTILQNTYYVYPQKGNDTDFSGEGWAKIDKVAATRKDESADFQFYMFDENYNVKRGELWIAAK